MSAPRPRRPQASAVNTPTEIRVESHTTISAEKAEGILNEFISASEAAVAPTIEGEVVQTSHTGFSNSTGNNVVLGQLRRVQRDLRGLPPLSVSEAPQKRRFDEEEAKKTKFEGVNKKIKFDDEEEEEEEKENDEEEKEKENDEEEKENEENEEEKEDEEEEKGNDEEDQEKEEQKEEKHKKSKKHKDKKDKKEKKEKKDKKHKKHKKD